MAKNIEICVNTGSGYEELYPKTLGNLVSGAVSDATNLTGNINASKVTSGTFGTTGSSSEYIFKTPVRFQSSSGSGYTSEKVQFGDGTECYIQEIEDGKLTIHSKSGLYVTTDSNSLYLNGNAVGGKIETVTRTGTGTNSDYTVSFSFAPKMVFCVSQNECFGGFDVAVYLDGKNDKPWCICNYESTYGVFFQTKGLADNETTKFNYKYYIQRTTVSDSTDQYHCYATSYYMKSTYLKIFKYADTPASILFNESGVKYDFIAIA